MEERGVPLDVSENLWREGEVKGWRVLEQLWHVLLLQMEIVVFPPSLVNGCEEVPLVEMRGVLRRSHLMKRPD